MSNPVLKIEPDFNSLLRPGATRQDVSFFVTPVGFDAKSAVQPARLAAAIIDISGSMDGAKIHAAFAGAAAFLEAMKASPRNYFAVYLFGKGKYRLIHPTQATESEIRKAQAVLADKLKQLVNNNGLEGSTNTAGGMQLVREDFNSLCDQGKVTEGFAALLTDGDYGDSAAVSDEISSYQAMAKKGRILKILARGVGTEWAVSKLRIITDGTLSPPPVVLANPNEVKADFEGIVKEAASQALSGVTMVIQRFNMGEIMEIGVRTPVNLDLSTACTNEGEKNIRVNLGSWDAETRLFYLAFEVNQPGNAPAIMAAKIWFEYLIGSQKVTTEPLAIKAQWARDAHEETLSQRVTRGVKLAQGIEGSQRRMREASELAKGGNIKAATDILGDLVKNAHADGDQGLIDQLKEFVDIEDAATGKVKFKAGTDAAAIMKLDTKSSVRRVRPTGDAAAAPAAEPKA
jgi:hypothetical protein